MYRLHVWVHNTHTEKMQKYSTTNNKHNYKKRRKRQQNKHINPQSLSVYVCLSQPSPENLIMWDQTKLISQCSNFRFFWLSRRLTHVINVIVVSPPALWFTRLQKKKTITLNSPDFIGMKQMRKVDILSGDIWFHRQVWGFQRRGPKKTQSRWWLKSNCYRARYKITVKQLNICVTNSIKKSNLYENVPVLYVFDWQQLRWCSGLFINCRIVDPISGSSSLLWSFLHLFLL